MELLNSRYDIPFETIFEDLKSRRTLKNFINALTEHVESSEAEELKGIFKHGIVIDDLNEARVELALKPYDVQS